MKDPIAPFQSEQRFSADVAHELRTPIAASRVLAQLALASQDINLCHDYLKDILKGLDRTSLIISQIQLVTGIHPEQVLKSRTDIVLRPMLASLVQEFTLIAGKKLNIENLIPEGITVFANEGCLLIVLRNLLDNALRYSGAEPYITVMAEKQDEHVLISVTDQGPGIAPEFRSRVLERGYRKPGTGQSGSGLGLSIVAEICALHGGSLSLRDGIGGKGLKVLISLNSTNTIRAQSKQTEKMC